MIKLGFIGCGYWGPNLIRNFNNLPSAEIKTICDLDNNKLASIKKIYPFMETTNNTADLFKNNNLDAIVIATPTRTHYSLARQTLLAGKHLLIEKPIATTSNDVKELIEIAEKKRKVLMVDHTFVYAPTIKKIKEMLTQKDLGKLYYFDSVRVNLGLFQQDINALWDLAPHDLSIIEYLFEKNPQYISAQGASHIKKGLENIVYVSIQFPGNFLAHIHVNWMSPVKIRLSLISGSKKMIVYNEMEPSEKVKIYDSSIKYKQDLENLNLSRFQYRMGDIYSPRIDDIESLSNVASHFLNCIIKNKKPITNGYFGLKITSMLESAQKSLKHGGRPVKINK